MRMTSAMTLFVMALVAATSARVTSARKLLVDTDATFYVDTTGASRGAGITTTISWNSFCEFILPFLQERGYEPPAYWCN